MLHSSRLVACLLTLFLVGCGSSGPALQAPDASSRLRAADTATLLVDVTVPEDVDGSTDLVDVPGHRTMGEALTDSTTAWLRRKGYRLDVLPSSVGYWLAPTDPFHVVRTGTDQAADVDPDSLPTSVLSSGRAARWLRVLCVLLAVARAKGSTRDAGPLEGFRRRGEEGPVAERAGTPLIRRKGSNNETQFANPSTNIRPRPVVDIGC